MARMEAVEARPEGAVIHLNFQVDSPGVIGWQLFDPATGAYLGEGEWTKAERQVRLRIALPPDEGPYQVQVAPVADRSRVILIDARVAGGRAEISPPRVARSSALRWARRRQAIPKFFLYPLRSLRDHRGLMWSMVQRDVLSRYRGSLGGALWTILNPLLLMLTYFFVFGVVMQARFGADPSRWGFVLYFLAGMLPWLAFAEAAGRAPQVILEHRNFVKKLVFPLETLPVNLVISGLVSECLGLAVFLAALLASRGAIPVTALWLPAVLLPQVLLTVGVCWMLAALGVFFRDLTQIAAFLLQLGFFLTPILYPESLIPPAAAPLLKLNPMLLLVRGYRSILLESRAPDLGMLAVFTAAAAALALLGHAWFHRLRKNFADVI
jgi:lipopolysaccharide transport system permease protein